ncbi:serine/arginine repetitive matrix protein 2 [Galendromus occidentalis]|uniref:Serine/arginine repetitive matrix protein 2 n=1 Tax=Galendromus occidentalis TaxID=34638 RepID=A0AAJ7WI04_9ACAR|nr:serine/arginine repetitive matrix protein 2 [Galendromus occidentalis]
MDESPRAESVDDIYFGLEKNSVPSQDTSSLENNSSSHQNSQDSENEDDDALVIDAQDDATEVPFVEPRTEGNPVKSSQDDAFDAFETGEWRLPASASTGALSESLDRIRDLATAVVKENQEAKGARSELEVRDAEDKSQNSLDEQTDNEKSDDKTLDQEDQSEDSSLAVVVEGDSEGDDDLNQQLLEEQLVKEKSPPKEPEKPFRREEEALNALNNVLDTLCKSKLKPKDEERCDTELNPHQAGKTEDDTNRKSGRDLYDNLEDFSSGESSLPDEGESDSDAVEGYLEAASEVSSSEGEMLKRLEAAEAAENDEGTPKGTQEADEQRTEEPSKSKDAAPPLKLASGVVKTNGATSFKLKRKTGLEEGELSESNSNGSHVSLRIRDLKRRKRRTRSQRNPLAPLRSRSPSPLSVRFSGDSSSDDSPVKAPLVLDRTAVRKVVLSPSPLRDEANNAAGNASTWKKLNSSTKNRNYRQSGNEITATNHLQTTLTVVATANKKTRRPDREVYQVRKRRSRSRSPVLKTKRRSGSKTKRRKRSLSPTSRSPKRRARSRSPRSPLEKRKKSKQRKQKTTEKRSKKKKKSKSHKKTKAIDRSRSRSASPGPRDSKKLPEKKRKSNSRSWSRSRSRSIHISDGESAVDSPKDALRQAPPLAPPKRRKKKNQHKKTSKDQGERVVIDLSQDTSPEREISLEVKSDPKQNNNKEGSKSISEKGDNLVISVNYKKKALQNIFGDESSEEEIDPLLPLQKKDIRNDKPPLDKAEKSSPVKKSPAPKGPQTPPDNRNQDEYDPCEPLGDSPSSTPTNDEPDQVRISNSPEKDSPVAVTSSQGKPTVAVLPIVDNKSPKNRDKRKVSPKAPPVPPLPPPPSKEKPPSPPPKLEPPPVPSFLFNQAQTVQPQYIVMNPFLVNPYMMPMQAATAQMVTSSAPMSQVSLSSSVTTSASTTMTTAVSSREYHQATGHVEGSPYSPGDSPLFNEPITPPTPLSAEDNGEGSSKPGGVFDQIAAGVVRSTKRRQKKKQKVVVKTAGQLVAEAKDGDESNKERYVKMDEAQMKILDELPSSAVEMQVKEKYLQKLHRQERVVEEVKLALKPFYNKKQVSKEDYKLIMKKCVPKICHNKNGEINPAKIKALVEGYVKRYRHLGKKHKAQTTMSAASAS